MFDTHFAFEDFDVKNPVLEKIREGASVTRESLIQLERICVETNIDEIIPEVVEARESFHQLEKSAIELSIKLLAELKSVDG